MEKQLLSVIVPVYQTEAYLPRCLDSIAAQTLTDYELILVNDGSRDSSPAIMADYAGRDGRIRQVHKENGGLSSARNAGLEAAKGKYILFIDSDDYVEPTLFADAVGEAERTGAQLVVWNYQRVDEKAGYGPYLKMEDETIDVDNMGLADYFYRYWLPYRHGFEACNKLFRRDVLAESGLVFQPNNEILFEDLLFTTMYLFHTHKIAALAKPYYNYYQRSDSIMQTMKPRAAHRLITLSVRLCEYARMYGREQELKNVLPVVCYKQICRGISIDPDMHDVYAAMEEYAGHDTVRQLLRSLISPAPLTMYTLRTRQGIFVHVRARLIALRWLRGDVKGAAALVQR